MTEQLAPAAAASLPLSADDLSRGIRQLDVLGARARGEPPAAYTTPPPAFLLLILTGVLYGILSIFWASAEYNEIRANWPAYRCSPAVMPFAKFYGHDLNETINFCMQQAVKEHAPGVVAPIYRAVSDVATTMDSTFEKALVVEEGVSSLLAGFDTFVANFVNSLRLVGTRMRMSVVRMQEIFARIHGVFIAFAFAAISAISFGESLACNPLVTFMGTISGVDVCCFPPETPVVMADGDVKPMESVRIGDRLWNESRVTSTYRFDGSGSSLVRIGSVTVSSGHYVRFCGHYIPAGEHPAAIPTASQPLLVCLATDTHQIPVLDTDSRLIVTFADYEESDDPEVILAAKKAAETLLCGSGSASATDAAVAAAVETDYSLGLDPNQFLVQTTGHGWIPIAATSLGDELVSGGSVAGIVTEECRFVVADSGAPMAASLFVARDDRSDCSWERICYREDATIAALAQPVQLMHLLIRDGEHCFRVKNARTGETFWVRDYCEAEDDTLQAPFDAAMRNKK